MKKQKFSLRKRLNSFSFAFNGLWILLVEEHNARIHLVGALCVVALGLWFEISHLEWIAVILAIGIVLTTETINTAMENLADYVSPGEHDSIRKVKDLSAAAVLFSSLTASIIGMIVFLPRVYTQLFLQM